MLLFGSEYGEDGTERKVDKTDERGRSGWASDDSEGRMITRRGRKETERGRMKVVGVGLC